MGTTTHHRKIRQRVTNEQKSQGIAPGYYSIAEQPMDLFKCPSTERCPGGRPGECAPGLQGAAGPFPTKKISKQPPQFAPNVWNIMEYVLHLPYKSMVRMVGISIFHTYRAFGPDLLAVFS